MYDNRILYGYYYLQIYYEQDEQRRNRKPMQEMTEVHLHSQIGYDCNQYEFICMIAFDYRRNEIIYAHSMGLNYGNATETLFLIRCVCCVFVISLKKKKNAFGVS